MKKRKEIFFSVFAVLAGCFMGAVLCEVTLRAFGPHWLKLRIQEVGVKNITGLDEGNFGSDKDWPVEENNGRFVRFTPLSKFKVWHYEYDMEANIDQWGGRKTLNSPGADKNALIPFLGDSFTFGVGVKDDETYGSLLSKTMSYPLINLGMPGSCLANHLDILEHRHAELGSPQLYVFNVFDTKLSSYP